jgi:hypothetical protein
VKKRKSFDCVKMKRDIQEKLQKRLRGLSPTEAEEFAVERIGRDPRLARVWREAKRSPVGTPVA